MLHLIRTLFSVVLVLAFTVVASPIQLGAQVESEPKGLAKRFQPIRPEASAPRPWVKTVRSLHRSRGLKEAPEEIAEVNGKPSSQQSSKGVSKTRRRPDADIATSRHTTGLSNPRPWVRQEEVISSQKWMKNVLMARQRIKKLGREFWLQSRWGFWNWVCFSLWIQSSFSKKKDHMLPWKVWVLYTHVKWKRVHLALRL